MFDIIRVLIALAGSAFCGAYDLKTTEIPDAVPIGMIIVGIAMHAYESFVSLSITPLLNSLTITGIFFVFSLFMYYRGYWGGGDGELLIAIGALLPTAPSTPEIAQTVSTAIPFSLNFFFNVFLVGAVYSLFYAIVFAAKDRKTREAVFSGMKGDAKIIAALAFAIFAILFFATTFSGVPAYMQSYSVFAAISFLVLIIVYRFAKIVEKQGFYRRIPVSCLKQGDMLGEDLPKLKIYKKLIRGLTAAEVKRIKAVKKFVVIREGVRFGPVFPMALAITIFYGNAILMFLSF